MLRKNSTERDIVRGENGMDDLRTLAATPRRPTRTTLVLWVFRDYDAHWCVRREGREDIDTFAGRDAALDRARALGRAHGSYRLYFQLRDGRVTEELFNTGGH